MRHKVEVFTCWRFKKKKQTKPNENKKKIREIIVLLSDHLIVLCLAQGFFFGIENVSPCDLDNWPQGM